MNEPASRERCVWQVADADGSVIGEGSYFESNYEAAVRRARHEAASYVPLGAQLVLSIGNHALLTYRL